MGLEDDVLIGHGHQFNFVESSIDTSRISLFPGILPNPFACLQEAPQVASRDPIYTYLYTFCWVCLKLRDPIHPLVNHHCPHLHVQTHPDTGIILFALHPITVSFHFHYALIFVGSIPHLFPYYVMSDCSCLVIFDYIPRLPPINFPWNGYNLIVIIIEMSIQSHDSYPTNGITSLAPISVGSISSSPHEIPMRISISPFIP